MGDSPFHAGHRPGIRRSGALGALMDEYERCTTELKERIALLPQHSYTQLVAEEGRGLGSIRMVVMSVIDDGFRFANLLRRRFGLQEFSHGLRAESPESAALSLNAMLACTEGALEGSWELDEREIDTLRLESAAGTEYTIEQLLEHAIVCVLRQRRQVDHYLDEQQDRRARD